MLKKEKVFNYTIMGFMIVVGLIGAWDSLEKIWEE